MARAVAEFSHNSWTKLIMNPGGWNQLQHLQTWANLQPSRQNWLPELYSGPEYWPSINIRGLCQQHDLSTGRAMSCAEIQSEWHCWYWRGRNLVQDVEQSAERAETCLKAWVKYRQIFLQIKNRHGRGIWSETTKAWGGYAQCILLAPTCSSGLPASHFNWKWERLWQKVGKSCSNWLFLGLTMAENESDPSSAIGSVLPHH